MQEEPTNPPLLAAVGNRLDSPGKPGPGRPEEASLVVAGEEVVAEDAGGKKQSLGGLPSCGEV